MPAKAKPEPPARDSSTISMLAEWVRQGTESFFATQRILLDLVVRQNANTLGIVRERLADLRSAPAAALTEIAGEGISNFIAAQRILLQLAERQNELVMTGLKETAAITPVAGVVTSMSDVFERGIATFIDMHQHFLTIAAKQTDLWIDAAKEGKPFDGQGAAELAREAMETFIRAQKKFLDVVAEETLNGADRRHGKPARKAELADLARQGAEAFIDAQKKLLDVAAQQVAVSVKVTRDAAKKLNPFPGFTLAEMTRNTVGSFVSAQKALLEVMSKPARMSSDHTATPKSRRTARKHNKPAPVPVPA
jgi:hypothetical protein